MKRRLPTLCPQEYTALAMVVTPCTRCNQWDKVRARCSVDTGAEHLPDEPPEKIPTCPIQDRCQHQRQTPDGPCVVRRKGLVCESAFVFAGMTKDDAMDHPLGFNADCVADPEQIAENMADQGAPPEEVAAYLAKWA